MHVLMAPVCTLHADGSLTDGRRGEMVVLPLAEPDAADHGAFGGDRRPHFVGLDTHADIDEVEVVALDVGPHVVMGHVVESLGRVSQGEEDAVISDAARLTAEMLDVAEQFPVGTVLRREGERLRAQVPLTDWGGRRPVGVRETCRHAPT